MTQLEPPLGSPLSTTLPGVGSPPPDDGSDLDRRVREIERPSSDLLLYYALLSLLLGPLFPILLIPLFFRYRSLRYRFEDEGVSMRWGILFRKEISLTYARIQDIHLASNAVERQFGLARVLIQTASGTAGAEMTIEGLHEFEAVRDFLYQRMRGAKGLSAVPKETASRTAAAAAPVPERTAREGGSFPASLSPSGHDELATALRQVSSELRALRESLARHRDRP